jgi:hypothetical protein
MVYEVSQYDRLGVVSIVASCCVEPGTKPTDPISNRVGVCRRQSKIDTGNTCRSTIANPKKSVKMAKTDSAYKPKVRYTAVLFILASWLFGPKEILCVWECASSCSLVHFTSNRRESNTLLGCMI